MASLAEILRAIKRRKAEKSFIQGMVVSVTSE
jgi:hypothetical protein